MPDPPRNFLEFLFQTSVQKTPKSEEVERVKKLTPEQQVDYVMESLPFLSDGKKLSRRGVIEPIGALLRRKLPFTADQIEHMVELGADPSYYFPFLPVLRLAESIPLTPALEQALRRMRKAAVLESGWGEVEGKSAIKTRIDYLLGSKEAGAPFEPAGDWSRHIAAEVTPAWRGVLESGRDITGREPSKKWREAAAARVAGIGREPFRQTAVRWLAFGPASGESNVQTTTQESDYQRGLLWSLADFSDAETCAAVARFGELCLRKIPTLGAVSQRSGNASVGVLAAMGGAESIAQLARLALRIKYQTAQRLLQEALEEAAQRQGISREELEEITVPAFGLDAEGRRLERCGEHLLELTAAGDLTCRTADGKPLKSIPEAVKRDFAEALKELKQAAKEIAPLRQAHRVRLERLLLTERGIPIETWRSAYIDHPLLGSLARRLIWQFAGGITAIRHDGALVEWNGAAVAPAGPVRLWHPIHSDLQTVLSWRCWLEDHQVQQPFKQAHREVYSLTDAERASGTSSNRFATHILRQHQFAALCAERGWRFRLMGQWDSHNTPYLELPHAGLRAELQVDFPRDESVTAHAIYLYLQTGQVRFVEGASPRPLESIPAAVFSEVMRDVDLFVGVAGIGNDLEWGIRPNAPFTDYWNSFSFGELTGAAQQRAPILEALLPKLAIADRCRVEDRFLWVRGDRATYKIHLGSGGVMIEPGSRYLCIVRGAATNIFLPFEGDTMLSLILSKAFLLAADKKITEPSILRQLP